MPINLKMIFRSWLIVLLMMMSSVVSWGNNNNNNIIIMKVQDWSEAHNTANITLLTSLYAQTVQYYGSKFTKKKCIADKERLFKKHPLFRQQIISSIQVNQLENGDYVCNFKKRVYINEKVKDYPSYLHFRSISGQWNIILESDRVTDGIKKSKQQPPKAQIPRNAIEVDVNGDGIKEYMWIVEPELSEKELECKGPCDSYAKCSNPKIPILKIEQCLGGKIENLGDLNGDGGDEIGLYPDWFTSTWHAYRVWSLQNSTWIFPIKPFTVWYDHLKPGRTLIRKDLKRKGYVIIRESDHDSDLMPKVIKKSVKIIP